MWRSLHARQEWLQVTIIFCVNFVVLDIILRMVQNAKSVLQARVDHNVLHVLTEHLFQNPCSWQVTWIHLELLKDIMNAFLVETIYTIPRCGACDLVLLRFRSFWKAWHMRAMPTTPLLHGRCGFVLGLRVAAPIGGQWLCSLACGNPAKYVALLLRLSHLPSCRGTNKAQGIQSLMHVLPRFLPGTYLYDWKIDWFEHPHCTRS